MLRRFSVNFAIFSMLVDAGLIALMLWLTTLLRPMMNELSFIAAVPGPVILPVSLYILFPLIWVMIFASFSIYDGKKYLRVTAEFAGLSWATCVAAISLAGILYLSLRSFSRAQFLLFVLLSYLAFLAWRALARLAFRLQRADPSAARRMLIVGAGPLGQMVAQRLRDHPDLERTFAGFVDSSPPDSFTGALTGSIADLKTVVEQRAVTDVILALPPHFFEQTRQAVEQLAGLAVRVWLVPGAFALALYKPAVEDLEGLPLLDLRASALDDYERGVKRAFDLALGSLALVLALPVLGPAALAVWLEDRGPALFRQKRVGENGKLFEMLKLRTMLPNAEDVQAEVQKRDQQGNVIHKVKDDPRVTRVGRILRRLSIDELPQLINVLKGEMSLVGPRPELPDLVEQYQPWQRQRFVVPPGITGWWQVNGRSDRPMHLNTEDDLYYVQNYSIWLDIQILVRTAWVVLIGRGSY
jgi:exopolysaccharide biosynthesis polyprenyl glycosylphosphotransferase